MIDVYGKQDKNIRLFKNIKTDRYFISSLITGNTLNIKEMGARTASAVFNIQIEKVTPDDLKINRTKIKRDSKKLLS